ncbi:DNA-binding protein [Gorgonomyces haynaldii]|nr:DNA-binding protein [Gorgonomyces haynaldii]
MDSLLELVHVSVHQLLYMRKIYPEELFEKASYRGLTVYQSRHPMLNDWISNAVKQLKNPKITQISVVFAKECVLEQWTFELEKRTGGTEDLRLGLMALIQHCAGLKDLPQDTTWSIQVDCDQSLSQEWIPTEKPALSSIQPVKRIQCGSLEVNLHLRR